MTVATVCARSGDPERARFIRALLVSVLLHGTFFALKAGPPSGVRAPSLPGGGVIEAVLRPAPASTLSPEPPAEQKMEPALAVPADGLPLTRPEATAPSAAAPSEPAAASQGRDTQAGEQATGEQFSASIPVLPALPTAARPVPRPASLQAPLNFSYPPNIRVLGGRVRVRLLIENTGRVEEMRIVAAVPPGFFDQAALQVLRAGRFAPGYVGAMPVPSYLFMEVSFGPGPQGQQVWYAGSAMAPPAHLRTASGP